MYLQCLEVHIIQYVQYYAVKWLVSLSLVIQLRVRIRVKSVGIFFIRTESAKYSDTHANTRIYCQLTPILTLL